MFRKGYLNENAVLLIFACRPRYSHKEYTPCRSLSKRYNVSDKTIREIWNCRSWTKLTRPYWTEAELKRHLPCSQEDVESHEASTSPSPADEPRIESPVCSDLSDASSESEDCDHAGETTEAEPEDAYWMRQDSGLQQLAFDNVEVDNWWTSAFEDPRPSVADSGVWCADFDHKSTYDVDSWGDVAFLTGNVAVTVDVGSDLIQLIAGSVVKVENGF